MKLIDIYKKSLLIIANNPAITVSFVIFLIASNLLAMSMINTNSIVLLLRSFCLFLLSLCFISGWFQIIKTIKKDGSAENKNFLAIFLEGIGKNIIPVGIGSFIYTILLILVLFLTGKIAHSIFGSLDFIIKDLPTLAQSNSALIEYFDKLTVDQKYLVYSWQLCFIFSSMVYNFILIFYFPSIIHKEDSRQFLKPIIALKDSFMFLLKNFGGALLIYFSIYCIYVILGILNALSSSNFALSIILLIVYIHFISFAVVLIFNYYEQKNHCINRCDSIGQNENIDKSGEEN